MRPADVRYAAKALKQEIHYAAQLNPRTLRAIEQLYIDNIIPISKDDDPDLVESWFLEGVQLTGRSYLQITWLRTSTKKKLAHFKADVRDFPPNLRHKSVRTYVRTEHLRPK